MSRRVALAAGAAFLLAGGAAQAAPTRIRGTITAVSADSLTVAEPGGGTETVALDPSTRYAGVVRSSIGAIHRHDFIGTATKGPDDQMVALEVVIFPPAMRGAGEGHYPWDGAAGGAGAGAESMTNGTVASATTPPAASPGAAGNMMTNGTVGAASDAKGGATLKVDYKGGSNMVSVPPGTPVVAFRPGGKALARSGGKVFLVAVGDPGHLAAKFVAVGEDGVTPPM